MSSPPRLVRRRRRPDADGAGRRTTRGPSTARARRACNPPRCRLLPRFKQWCDEYFYLSHRGEARGVGGIFYDDLDSGDFERDFAFTRDVGEAFRAIYPEIVRRHMDEPWSQPSASTSSCAAAVGVEFNLLHDRGTRFGLMTGGNVDAILMSLPPEVPLAVGPKLDAGPAWRRDTYSLAPDCRRSSGRSPERQGQRRRADGRGIAVGVGP